MFAILLQDTVTGNQCVIGPFTSKDAADFYSAEHEEELYHFDVDYVPFFRDWPKKE